MTLDEQLEYTDLSDVEFRAVPVAEALVFLQKESARLDADNPNRSRDGVPVAWLLPEAVASKRLVSLHLRGVSLREALRYTAEVAGLEMIVSESGVMILPAPLIPALERYAREQPEAQMACVIPGLDGDQDAPVSVSFGAVRACRIVIQRARQLLARWWPTGA